MCKPSCLTDDQTPFLGTPLVPLKGKQRPWAATTDIRRKAPSNEAAGMSLLWAEPQHIWGFYYNSNYNFRTKPWISSMAAEALGTGYSGAVLLARNNATGMKYAVKAGINYFEYSCTVFTTIPTTYSSNRHNTSMKCTCSWTPHFSCTCCYVCCSIWISGM